MKYLRFIFVLTLMFSLAGTAAIINIPADQPTIQAGIDSANPRDTILVHPGTYNEHIFFRGKNLVVGSLYLTTGDTSYITQTIISPNNYYSVVDFQSSRDTLAVLCGFTIHNRYSGSQDAAIQISTGSPQIIFNIIENIGDYAIQVYSINPPLIAHNIIRYNFAGIYLSGSGARVQANYISHNNGNGIYATYNETLSIVNNILAENQNYGIYVYIPTGISANTIKIINNTITNNDNYGIYVNRSPALILKNNIIINNNAGLYITTSYNYGTPIADYNNIWNNTNGNYIGLATPAANDISVSPLFLDSVAYNFHLSDYSPCIGAGDSIFVPSIDMEGNPRPDPTASNPDLGALENHLGTALVGPAIRAFPDSLNFGDQFLGLTVTDSLVVRNVGNTPLNVTSISSDNSDYNVNIHNFILTPGGYQKLLISFMVNTLGKSSGTLTIASNDPSQPSLVISLTGNGLAPPDISINPASLDDSLLSNQSSSHNLQVGNIGSNDLIWNISVSLASDYSVVESSPKFKSNKRISGKDQDFKIKIVQPQPDEIFNFTPLLDLLPSLKNVEAEQSQQNILPETPTTPLEDIRQHLNNNYLDVTTAIPNRFDFSEGISGYSISDGGNDMYDGGNYLSTSLGGYINYSDNQLSTSAYLGLNNQYFSRKYPGLFVFIADVSSLNYFDINGNLGADGAGTADGAILQTHLNGATYYGFVKRVFSTSEPSVNHLVIISENPQANHEFSTNTNDDYHRIINLNGTTRIYYLLYAGQNGYYIDNTATLNIMNTFLTAIGLAPSWISVDPDSGRTPPNGTSDINISFNSTGLEDGNYNGDILINSNDPDEPIYRVPVSLAVTAVADIAVNHDTLDFGELFVGLKDTLEIEVTNEGMADLLITSTVTIPDVYSVKPSYAGIYPGDTRTFRVIFYPRAAEDYPGSLTFVNNDPDSGNYMVTLNGIGVEPPVASTAPDSLSQDLFTGQTSSQTLTLHNSGGSDLDFQIAIHQVKNLTEASKEQFSQPEGTTAAAVQFLKFPWLGSSRGSFPPLAELAGSFGSDLSPVTEVNSDGQTIPALTTDQIGRFRSSLKSFYEQRNKLLIRENQQIPEIAVVGSGRQNLIYYLLQDSILVAKYLFTEVPDYSSYTQIENYDGLMICEQDYNIDNDEAVSINLFFHSGKPVLLGMDDLDDNFVYWPGTDSLLLPVFGISGVHDGDLFNGRLNPDNPISQGINQVYSWGSDNDWYIPNGADWIVAGSDSNYYAVSYEGISRSVLMGENLNSIWMAGNQQLIRNAITWMMEGAYWLTVIPDTGTVAAGSSVDLEVTFDAAGMMGGDYNARLLINTNDPVNPEIDVPVHLNVTGAPVITVSDSSLNFGNVFIGDTVSRTLMVYNRGTDLLSISNMVLSKAVYTTDTTSFDLNPGESRGVTISFTPPGEDVFVATLTIISNDPESPNLMIDLTGTGLEPPGITVSPDSLYEDLFTGQTSGQTLVIGNTGGSDLFFNITTGNVNNGELLFQSKIPASWFRTSTMDDIKNQPEKNSLSRFSFSQLVTLAQSVVGNISPSTSRLIDGMPIPVLAENELIRFRSALNTYYRKRKDLLKKENLRLPEIGVSGSYGWNMMDSLLLDSLLTTQYQFTLVSDYSQYQQIAYFDGLILCEGDADINLNEALSISAFFNSGKPVLLGMDDLDDNFLYHTGTDTLLKPVFGISDAFDADYSWGSLNPDNSITYGVPRIFQNMGNLGSDNDWYTLNGADWIFAGSDGHYYGVSYEERSRSVLMGEILIGIWMDGNAQLIRNAIQWMMEGAYWLSVSPDSGTVAASYSTDVSAIFDATGMMGGDYDARIIISSNDPVQPEIEVPAHLHVTGAPNIAVSDSSLDFGNVFTGATATLPLEIFNHGTDLLTINGINLSHSDFSLDTTSFSLSPGQRQTVMVSFAPTSAALITGTLIINSDDPDTPALTVELRGEGLIPPDISVIPDSLQEDLFTGQTSTRIITIGNTGGNNLEYNIRITGNQVINGLPGKISGNVTEQLLKIKNSADPHFQSHPLTAKLTSLKSDNNFSSQSDVSLLNQGVLFEVNLFVGNGIWELDPLTGSILDSINVPELQITGSEGLAFDGKYLYYVNGYGTNTIYRIERSTGNIVGSISISGLERLDGLAYSGNLLYARGEQSGTIYAIDFEMATIVDQYSGLSSFGAMSYGGNRGTLFVSDYYGSQIIELDPENWSIVNRIPVSRGDIYGLAYSNALNVLFASVFMDTTIYTLDPDSGTVLNAFWGHSSSALAADEFAGPGWISAVPLSGTTAVGATTDITVTFDAAGLIGGDYSAAILISSNDPDESEVRVPAHLHVTGVPDIEAGSDSIHFKPTYVGYGCNDSLTIRNVGTDSLVVNNISCTNSAFSANLTNFILLPGEHGEIVINFQPPDSGNFAGFLTISSNDSDETILNIPLSGTGIYPPVITITPDSLSGVAEAGDSTEESLTLHNTGAGSLDWNIIVTSNKNPTFTRASHDYLRQRFGELGARDIRFFNNTIEYSIEGEIEVDGTQHKYSDARISPLNSTLGGIKILFISPDWSGFQLELESRGAITYINIGQITQNQLDSTDVLVINDSFSPDTSTISNIRNWIMAGGGLIIDGDNNLPLYNDLIDGSGILYETANGTPGITTDITPHPVTIGITSYEIGTSAMASFQISGKALDIIRDMAGLPQIAISRLGLGRITANGDEDLFDYAIGDSGHLALGLNAIEWMVQAYWCKAMPSFGTLGPGNSIDLAIKMNATNLDAGIYLNYLMISSNDPAFPLVTIPVSLEVNPASGISDNWFDKIPHEYILYQNYPNPFNPHTSIRFGIPKTGRVKIELFNVLGQKVMVLLDKLMPAGYHQIDLDGSQLASGLYFYRIQSDKFQQLKKLMLLK